MMEVEMKIRGLMMDPVTNMPIVILKDVGSDTVLPIWVGIYEANAIALEIEKVTTPRPMTHDLIKNVLTGLDAERLVWAAGYFTDIDYFVPEAKIEGKGTVKNVRFEARPKNLKRYDQEWDWDNNPFKGTDQLQGLKVLMVMLNNWDLKNSNHRIIYAKDENELRYIVSDLGVAFGKTGNSITHNRNRPDEFVKQGFIKNATGEHIAFDFRATHDQMLDNVTVAQAKWIGNILSQLSAKQISDAFRAANYTPEEIEMLTRSLRARIRRRKSGTWCATIPAVSR